MRYSYFKPGDPLDVRPSYLVADTHCPYCQRVVRFPLPADHDGSIQAEADFWKERYGQLKSLMAEEMKAIETRLGPTPLRKEFQEALKKLGRMIKRMEENEIQKELPEDSDHAEAR